MEIDGQFDDAEVEAVGVRIEKDIKLESDDEADNGWSDDFSDEGFEGDEYVDFKMSGRTNPNQQSAGGTSLKSYQPSEKLFKKFEHKINIDQYEVPTRNVLQEQSKRNDKVSNIYLPNNFTLDLTL